MSITDTLSVFDGSAPRQQPHLDSSTAVSKVVADRRIKQEVRLRILEPLVPVAVMPGGGKEHHTRSSEAAQPNRPVGSWQERHQHGELDKAEQQE